MARRGSREIGADLSTSLHARILDDVRHLIISGEWPPGYRIPSELEMTRQYACSRMTVNRALTQLARAGLIERRKRAGSLVAHPSNQAALLEIHDIQAEVEALHQRYRYELLRREIRSNLPAGANWEGLATGTRVLSLVCRHTAGDTPFCLEDRLINLGVVPSAERAEFSAIAPSVWLLNQVPWSEAEHRISAQAADLQASPALQIPLDAPCLVVERQTWNTGEPVTKVRLTYPASLHAVVARFRPTG